MPRIPLEKLLVVGSRYSTTRLGRRLLREGLLPERCDICRITSWLDGPVPLELDHINGDRQDNRLSNLRLLCPNCHALTGTYRGRNVRRNAYSRAAPVAQPVRGSGPKHRRVWVRTPPGVRRRTRIPGQLALDD